MRRVAAAVSGRVPSVLFATVSSFSSSANLRHPHQQPQQSPHYPQRHEQQQQQQQQKSRGRAPVGHGEPVKDRFPPIPTDMSDPRRRLALLVDGSSIDPRVFHNTIFPAACKVGVPVLVRVFAVQLSSEWEAVVAGSASSEGDVDGNDAEKKKKKKKDTNNNDNEAEMRHVDGTPRCPAEFFRVERFIPVTMQMEADASHIFDFRNQNKIEAVCFICTEVDRSVFEGFLGNIAGNGFNQYILDELGMAKEVLEDGRSADGAPTITQ